jgi:AcrR family transcriptional regulator
MSAEDRRAMVVAAAVSEFAGHGFEGTATESIAARAGVSQPYLFQLFGSKRDLFIATMREVFDRTWRAFEAAADAARATDPSVWSILHGMAEAYCDLLEDRDLLLCQLHAYAACADDGIRAAVRAEFAELYRRVGKASGADVETLDGWFARGMLMNTMAAIAPDLTSERDALSLAMLTPIEGGWPPRPAPVESVADRAGRKAKVIADAAAARADKAAAVAESAARQAAKDRVTGRTPARRKPRSNPPTST